MPNTPETTDAPTEEVTAPKPKWTLRSFLLGKGVPEGVIDLAMQSPGGLALVLFGWFALAGPPLRAEVNEAGETVAYTSYFGLFAWYADDETERLRIARLLSHYTDDRKTSRFIQCATLKKVAPEAFLVTESCQTKD